MAVRALVDTGALVALLSESDLWHERCREAVASLRLPLVTSMAVLTELFHFMEGRHAMEQAWRLVERTVAVEPIGPEELPALHVLMARYHDCPMDFADATLVHVAGRLRLDTVFTVDVDDFETYRLDGRRRFRVVPGR